jgi:peptidyl-Lys metalloendopeptidase
MNPATWPVSLSFVSASPDVTGWKYQVEVTVKNTLTRPLKLDGPSVAEQGQLRNDLFEVTVDGARVQYHGMMAKRAPPSKFVVVAPGASYRVVVELGKEYPIPAGPHRVTVTFSHHNHFSPDDFDLKSEAITFDLAR